MYYGFTLYGQLVLRVKFTRWSCCEEVQRVRERIHWSRIPWAVEGIWAWPISKGYSQTHRGERKGKRNNFRLSFFRNFYRFGLFSPLSNDQSQRHHWVGWSSHKVSLIAERSSEHCSRNSWGLFVRRSRNLIQRSVSLFLGTKEKENILLPLQKQIWNNPVHASCPIVVVQENVRNEQEPSQCAQVVLLWQQRWNLLRKISGWKIGSLLL